MKSSLALVALLLSFGQPLHAENKPVLCGEKTFLVPVPAGFSEIPQDSRLFTLQQKIQEDLGNRILAYLKDPAHTVMQPATLMVFVTKELEGIEAPADAFKDWLRSQEAPADAATSTQELQDAVKNYKERISRWQISRQKNQKFSP